MSGPPPCARGAAVPSFAEACSQRNVPRQRYEPRRCSDAHRQQWTLGIHSVQSPPPSHPGAAEGTFCVLEPCQVMHPPFPKRHHEFSPEKLGGVLKNPTALERSASFWLTASLAGSVPFLGFLKGPGISRVLLPAAGAQALVNRVLGSPPVDIQGAYGVAQRGTRA